MPKQLMHNKEKITDIFEETVIVKKVLDEHGVRGIVEEKFKRKRPVVNLPARSRAVHFVVDSLVVNMIQLPIVLFYIDSPSIFLPLLMIFVFFAYYILCEFCLQKTIGKYITRSIVVNEYGDNPDFTTICSRTLFRIIPLEPISFLLTHNETWWHDTWTNTYVISKSELSLINWLRTKDVQKD
jgi:uncharacterized RDD family membrane protein YckC